MLNIVLFGRKKISPGPGKRAKLARFAPLLLALGLALALFAVAQPTQMAQAYPTDPLQGLNFNDLSAIQDGGEPAPEEGPLTLPPNGDEPGCHGGITVIKATDPGGVQTEFDFSLTRPPGHSYSKFFTLKDGESEYSQLTTPSSPSDF